MDEDIKQVVFTTPLQRIYHPKGDVYHAMKMSDPGFDGFGEAYFTTILQGETKGWKRHSKMYMNLIVPTGMVRFHIHDECDGITLSYDLGSANYGRLSVPPGFWVAFHGLGSDCNLILNIASIEHDPLESSNVPIDNFPIEKQP